MLYGINHKTRSSGDSDELPWVDARPAENEKRKGGGSAVPSERDDEARISRFVPGRERQCLDLRSFFGSW